MTKTAADNFLNRIAEHKRIEVQDGKLRIPLHEIRSRLDICTHVRDFESALTRNASGIPAVIAEIKKASPSRGIIRNDFDPVQIARSYQSAGASAISILTDQHFFQGSLDYIGMVKSSTQLPILRKDFIIDRYQVFESRAAGADAILLIAALLEADVLKEYLALAYDLGLQCLVEVHNEHEMEVALSAGSRIIGINNRDLRTFNTSIETTYQLADVYSSRSADSERKIVSESGISLHEDLVKLGEAGVDAVLIGEALMREADIESKLRELIG